MREKSVFSELIGQRQQENPQTEAEVDEDPSIDTGLIGDDNVDDFEVEVGNRGFFEEPDFGFNTGRERFEFPGDERGGNERVPILPEIENLENREPELYPGRYGGQSYYHDRQ